MEGQPTNRMENPSSVSFLICTYLQYSSGKKEPCHHGTTNGITQLCHPYSTISTSIPISDDDVVLLW